MRSHSLVESRPVPPVASPLLPGTARSGQAAAHTAFIGRAGETASILRAVRQPGSAGAVVVGAAGIGKTALLHHVQRSLAENYLVRVRGLRSATSSPFRALSFLLSELPGTVTHPALVFTAVSTYLRAEAGGRRVVFAVDNAEHLDRSSSTLIGQLVAANVASVVLTVTDFAQADPVFMTMWRNASLRRLDLAPFTFEETRLFVESELDAPISREGLEALWAVGGGNLPATRAALRGYVQRGTLARRGAAWVLLPGRPVGQDLVAHSPLLLQLAPNQRSVVNLVALAGTLDWSDLARGTDCADLDALQDAGILVIDTGVEPRARLATPGLSAAVAEAVGASEASDLYQHLQGLRAAPRQLAADPARLVAWLMRAAHPVSEDQAVAAAAALNDDGRYSRAAELLAALDLPDSDRLVYQAVRAALGQGSLRTATLHLSALADREDRLDRTTWTLSRIAESRMRRLRPVVDAPEPIAEASERVAAWQQQALEAGDDGAVAELARLERRLFAERAALASFSGRYSDNLGSLAGVVDTDLAASAGREELEFQVEVQSLLLEAQVVVDDRSLSHDLARSLARLLVHPDVPYGVADAALLRVEVALLMTGGWSDTARLLGSIRHSNARWSFRSGSLAQLFEGLTMIALGRARDAGRALEPVVEQLRIADPHGILPLAAATLTFSHALAGPLEQVIAHLPLSEPGRGSSWAVRRAARHYQLLASARTENRGEAARRLQDRASSDLQQGARVWALVSLAAAVRLGRQEAVADLGALAATVRGPLARTCSLYSRALLDSDVGLLIEAMECAAASDDYRLVADIAQSGINATTRNQDRTGLRVIQRRLRELLPDAPQADAGGVDLDSLTAREREVAALAAAGRSNRAIAQKLVVSVRTVEGHLYQVYSKLSVSTRAELAELVPAESGL